MKDTSNQITYNKRQIGSQYEDIAVRYLCGQGHSIIKRNYRTSYGEIDIISRDDDTIVFTECKYRSTAAFGTAIEAVNTHKQKKISRVALYFCSKYGYSSFPCRFDVIGIDKYKNITHIKNAFDYI